MVTVATTAETMAATMAEMTEMMAVDQAVRPAAAARHRRMAAAFPIMVVIGGAVIVAIETVACAADGHAPGGSGKDAHGRGGLVSGGSCGGGERCSQDGAAASVR